jgi:hypothetical protein
VPTVSVETVRVLVPVNVWVPSVAPPFLKVTVPEIAWPEGDETVAVKVTLWPKADGLPLDVTVAVVLYLFTVSLNFGEVLGENLVSPEYVAVMERVPAASEEVVNVAMPPARDPVPSVELPSLKVTTSPSGGAPELELTVAVKVTVCPTVVGFEEDVVAVLVAILFTTCFNTGEVLEVKCASPPYTAVMLKVPTLENVLV